MNLREAFRAGARELSANKFRSTLSFAAISVGVASLLYTLAQTRGMQAELKKQLELMGPGRMTIEAKRDYVSRGLSEGLTSGDAEAIAAELPDLFMVYPRSVRWATRFVHGRTSIDQLRVIGVTPDFRKRDWVYKVRGRFINQWDIRQAARVAVFVEVPGWFKKPFWANFWRDANPYNDFSKRHDLLGQQVRLQDSVFTVVGVLKPPPRDLDPRWDSWETPHVIVPITAFQRHIGPDRRGSAPDTVQEIRIDTGSEATLGLRRRQIEAVLKRRHRGEEDFEIKDMREEVEGEMEQMRKYVVAGLFLGLVSLIAGGTGIMNVTLATIFSRIKEIGIRRAVGAAKEDILAQFLLEAAMLGAAGGLAGVALGVGGLKLLAQTGGREIAEVTWLHCVEVVALGAIVSAIFALLPAYRASKLDPVEALKAE